jgi:Ca-activated chloride channel family protein
MRWLLFAARLVCVILLIVAIARPRKGTKISEISTEGVAMEIVVDRSGSMRNEMVYEGKSYNRLEVVKKVVADFVGGGGDFKGRAEDLVGLITFARYSDTLSPLSHGHNVMLDFLKKTEVVSRNNEKEDGTAIGDAIALAAARLKKAEEEIIERRKKLSALSGEDMDDDLKGFKIKSKVIILLTDGSNNAGEYQPLAAATLAADWGIKIYTIGIGGQNNRGGFFGTRQEFDEALLQQIARKTKGSYGRADSGEQLQKIYKEIDKLEKTEVKSIHYTQYAERFGTWALAALCLLGFEILAGCTIFRKVP